ncbi:hypothetical protein ABZ502_32645 [Streptomyces abikoensis]|uniref:hypothetical protein n=1 Tax=Streptomyces abikoensis TaxID=97398 RepID=UPI0033EAF6F6
MTSTAWEPSVERRRAITIAVILVGLAAAVGLAITLNRSSPKHDKEAAPPAQNTAPQDNVPSGPLDSVPAVVEPDELAAAHKIMREYLVAIGTYTYRSDSASWTAKARAFTDGSKSMGDQTSLPTGRAWAECVKSKCSSTATADLKRDTVISNAPVEGAGRSVTTLAATTVTLHQDKTTTQTTEFQITAAYTGGEWKVSSLQLATVGNAGIEER